MSIHHMLNRVSDGIRNLHGRLESPTAPQVTIAITADHNMLTKEEVSNTKDASVLTATATYLTLRHVKVCNVGF